MLLAGLFALVIGYVSLRRSGIYFSILTLAFAQMSYNLAYSVLTPITNGETGLQVRAIRSSPDMPLLDGDIRVIDQALGIQEVGVPITNLFGLKMSGYPGFYFCAVMLIICFFLAMCITKSNFGMMLKAIKSNQNRLNYTGIHTRPYLIAAFVISGMYAGLAGSLLAVTDPIAGAERMQWTASGEVVLMTILGGVGTLIGPVLGAGLIKFAEQKVSSWNTGILNDVFTFLPDTLRPIVVDISSLFVGEGWHMTLGLLFMVIVIFLPGGLMEGINRITERMNSTKPAARASDAGSPAAAAGKEEDHGKPTGHARRSLWRFRRVLPDKVLHIDDVHKSFAGLHALSDVDLDVRKGETHAIIGPNGAGKSTLLNVCVGRLRPDRGAVVFDGDMLTGKTPHEINQLGVARVFQTPEVFPDLSVLENVMVPALSKRDGHFKLNPFPAFAGEEEIREEAKRCSRASGWPDQTHASSMSRGDKRRLELAMGLIQHPRLLLLDEPTAGMARDDTNATIDLLKKIKEGGMTKVIIEHDMHVVFSLADRISVLAGGRIIAQGTPDEIKNNPKVKEAYLGEEQV